MIKNKQCLVCRTSKTREKFRHDSVARKSSENRNVLKSETTRKSSEIFDKGVRYERADKDGLLLTSGLAQAGV